MTHGGRDAGALDRAFDALVDAALKAWERHRAGLGERFHTFLPSDYPGARAALEALRGRGDSFVELGSGVGFHTIAASLLGFRAHGIEIEPDLVEESERLNRRFGGTATFAVGSYVPDAWRDEVELLPGDFSTSVEGADGWEELGLAMDDVDVLYGYVWPGEEDWLVDMVRRCARPGALLLLYASGEGYLEVEV